MLVLKRFTIYPLDYIDMGGDNLEVIETITNLNRVMDKIILLSKNGKIEEIIKEFKENDTLCFNENECEQIPLSVLKTSENILFEDEYFVVSYKKFKGKTNNDENISLSLKKMPIKE